ncbi:MAG: hypothetical protein PHT84_02340 [Candidatus Pacebacteria bacterium]|nr:hypothetical protein [Candidatus Paceibacterota bacterium]
MLYVLVGNDTAKKNSFVKEITQNREIIFFSTDKLSKETILNYAQSVSLFGLSQVVIADNLIGSKEVSFSKEEIGLLKQSGTIFIFLEDKILAVDKTKYSKFAEIKSFDKKEEKVTPQIDVFAITNSFERKDKIKTWLLYRQAIDGGIEPEAISGVIFWKIKMMILNGGRFFKEEELKKQASEIVSLHHRAHRGEVDFVAGLEQFILSSLS